MGLVKEIKHYYENSNVASFKRIENSNGFSFECTYNEQSNELTFKNSNGYSYELTYDENGNVLTYKNSNGDFKIKGEWVAKEEYDKFINTLNN